MVNSAFIIHHSKMDITVLILLLLAVAFLLRIDFIFYILYICIGLYAWSRWYPGWALKQLKIRREYNDHAFWGETVLVTIRLQNERRLPLPWITVQESQAVELTAATQMSHVAALRGRDTVEFSYKIKAWRRGYYQLGPMRLSSGDLFGLTKEKIGRYPADYLTVYPRITPLSQLGLPSRLPFGTIASRQRLFEDPTRPAGVRDFRSGDSIRQINWKTSAHTRQLMVKTYQPAISLETAVLLNLHLDDYAKVDRANRIEWAVEVAASLAAHLVDQRQAVGLLTNGIDPLGSGGTAVFDEESGRLVSEESANRPTNQPIAIPPRPGRANLMKILERLARIEAGKTTAFTQWTPTACIHLGWGVTILAITSRGDEAVCQTLHQLVRTGFNPILITIEPDANFGLVRERARRLGFAAYNISQRSSLSQWQQSQQQRLAA
jgi:uncharacterized protein (DUF58 family)